MPQTTLFTELNWKPRDWVSTAIEGLYRSKVYVDTNQQRAAPAYSVFNWRAQLSEGRALDLSPDLRLDNLLDRRYGSGSVIVGMAMAAITKRHRGARGMRGPGRGLSSDPNTDQLSEHPTQNNEDQMWERLAREGVSHKHQC